MKKLTETERAVKKLQVLTELRTHGNSGIAADRANISRQTIFYWRKSDKAFELAFKTALRNFKR